MLGSVRGHQAAAALPLHHGLDPACAGRMYPALFKRPARGSGLWDAPRDGSAGKTQGEGAAAFCPVTRGVGGAVSPPGVRWEEGASPSAEIGSSICLSRSY